MNYIHILGLGHFKSFLEHWHSLYRYDEQQGWESLNVLVSSFWHHRMQKSGYKHVAKHLFDKNLHNTIWPISMLGAQMSATVKSH